MTKGVSHRKGYQILNSENKALTSSMEDYLEMIYRTCGGGVRQGEPAGRRA